MSGESGTARKRVARHLPAAAIALLVMVAAGGIWFGAGRLLVAGPSQETMTISTIDPTTSAVISATPQDSIAVTVSASASEWPGDSPSPSLVVSAAVSASSGTTPAATATTHPAVTPSPTPTPLGPVHWATPTPRPTSTATPTRTPTHAPTATPHLPNLTVGVLTLSATTKCGTAFRVNASVTNTGPVTSSEVRWRVGDYYSSWHYGLGGGTIPALPPHGSTVVNSYSVLIDYGCGSTHVLMVQVDYDGHLTEGNESDNQSHAIYTLAHA
jgi:hypothetical protein